MEQCFGPTGNSGKIEFESPAEKSAWSILKGVQILQKYNAKASLCALDKTVLCGPGVTQGAINVVDADELKRLGWLWSSEYDSWEYYTGHG